MTEVSRREMLVGGTLVATAMATGGLAWAEQPAALPTTSLAELVPESIGRWQFVPAATMPIPQGEGAGDPVYDQLVSRHYRSETELPIMLLVAYGQAQSGSTQLHRPEVCYPAAGFRIAKRGDAELRLTGAPAVPARVLTGIAPARTEQILYWSRVGREFPTGGVAQRWSVLRQTLAAGVPDGVLVRISTVLPDYGAALPVLGRFAAALVESGGPTLRRLLLGTA